MVRGSRCWISYHGASAPFFEVDAMKVNYLDVLLVAVCACGFLYTLLIMAGWI